MSARNGASLCIAWALASFWPVRAVAVQVLHGHVPSIVAKLNLQPTGRLAATNHLQLSLGLPLRNSTQLSNLLVELYDPASPKFRQFLTAEQFTGAFGPVESDYQAVIDFATAHGLNVTAGSANRLLLVVDGTVADIEKTFHLTLQLYPHPTEGRFFYAPDSEPSLDLAVPVLCVSGLDNFVVPRPMIRKANPIQLAEPIPALGSGPAGTYMGNDFRRAYVSDVSLTGAGQRVGLLEFDGFFTKDVTAYESLANLPKVHLKTVLLDGFKGRPGPANIEVALDIDMAISMAPGLSEVIIYEGQLTDSILNRMATDNRAKQLSASWTYPIDATTELIFQEFAAQGQSFFNASGDSDAWNGPVAPPADDPYITVVGGTTLSMTTNGGAYISETVWNWGFGTGTGGGVSTSYSIPNWQRNINPTLNHASTTRRNIPDVAMTADNVFVIANDGQRFRVGGTSCATPLWAAFIALANQQALAAGKPTVGFLNPAVYALGAGPLYGIGFHDVLTGNNTSAGSPTDFFAVPGFDLCTGWGSPAGQELITALAGTDGLLIDGAAGFAAGGSAGGPFSVASGMFSLTNQGTVNLNWQASSDATWLSISPMQGSLAPHQPPLNVAVSLSSAASNLTAGFYSASIWFTNLTTGFVQARKFSLAVAQGRYGGAVLGLNPVAYWQLNETNYVPPADLVANTGSLAPAATGFGLGVPLQGESGIVAECFRFSNPYLDFGYFGAHVDVPFNAALNPTGAFAIELWAKPFLPVPDFLCPAASIDATAGDGTSRFGWVLYQTPNSWQFRIGAGLDGYAATNNGGVPLIGEWNHIVGVYDGTKISLYVNGQLVDGPTAAPGFSPNTNINIPLRLGATTFPNRTFEGWVDEVAFYTNALGPDRIAAHYSKAKSDPSSYPAEVLADQPVGYWQLDEPLYWQPEPLPTSVNIGSSGPNANGVYQPGSRTGSPGVPGAVFGIMNFGCQLTGTGYVDLPGWALNFTGPLSLVLWVKADPAQGITQCIAGKGTGAFRLLLDGQGYPHFADGEQSSCDLVGTARIDDGMWHQIAGIYDGANTELLYVDGQLAASTAFSTNAVTGNTNEFLIGSNPDGEFFQLFNGVVDEVCIFTNALTAIQLGQLFSARLANVSTPPLFQSLTKSAGTMLLSWTAEPGRLYQVQYKIALTQTSWSNLGIPFAATNHTASISDVMTDSQRFYRVILLP